MLLCRPQKKEGACHCSQTDIEGFRGSQRIRWVNDLQWVRSASGDPACTCRLLDLCFFVQRHSTVPCKGELVEVIKNIRAGHQFEVALWNKLMHSVFPLHSSVRRGKQMTAIMQVSNPNLARPLTSIILTTARMLWHPEPAYISHNWRGGRRKSTKRRMKQSSSQLLHQVICNNGRVFRWTLNRIIQCRHVWLSWLVILNLVERHRALATRDPTHYLPAQGSYLVPAHSDKCEAAPGVRWVCPGEFISLLLVGWYTWFKWNRFVLLYYIILES